MNQRPLEKSAFVVECLNRIRYLCDAPHWSGDHVSRRDRIYQLADMALRETDNRSDKVYILIFNPLYDVPSVVGVFESAQAAEAAKLVGEAEKNFDPKQESFDVHEAAPPHCFSSGSSTQDSLSRTASAGPQQPTSV